MFGNMLEGSWFVAAFRRLKQKWRRRFELVWRELLERRWVREWIAAWQGSPLQVGGVVLTSAVIANALMLVLLDREIGIGGIILRVFLLLLGLAGLTGSGDWRSVREGSWILRFFCPKRKEDSP